jgi:phosphatidate cytidylyltransferase
LNTPPPVRPGKTGFVDPAVITRIATAIVGIPLVIAVVIVGGSLYKAVIVVVALGAGFEAFHMMRGRGHKPALVVGLAMTGLLAVALGAPMPLLWWQATVLVGAMAAGLWFLVTADSHDAFLDWAITVALAVYAGGLTGSLIGVRFLENGTRLVILVLVLNWAYDTGAYFTGRTIGRTPFMSKISQSKTWEGVIGGFVTTVAVALIAAYPTDVRIGTAVIVSFAVAVSAQTGDLVESLIKRYAQVKDSGTIIPGHGGVLDRMDSLMFSGTAAYYVFLLAGYR